MNKTQGFTFHGTGTLRRIDAQTTKAGKSIKTLVLEVADDRFPQMVPVKVFAQLAERVFHVGDVMTVNGRVGGRDYNGRCYGDMVAQAIEVIGRDEQAQQNLPAHRDEDPDLVPF